MRPRPLSSKHILISTSIFCVVCLAVALFSQHALGMQPCAYCVLQRLFFLGVAGLSGATAVLTRFPGGKKLTAMGIGGSCFLSMGGLVTALIHHFGAEKMDGCNQSLASSFIFGSGLDTFAPSIFGIYASCQEAQTYFLGVNYSLLGVTAFLALTVVFGYTFIEQTIKGAHNA